MLSSSRCLLPMFELLQCYSIISPSQITSSCSCHLLGTSAAPKYSPMAPAGLKLVEPRVFSNPGSLISDAHDRRRHLHGRGVCEACNIIDLGTDTSTDFRFCPCPHCRESSPCTIRQLAQQNTNGHLILEV